MRIPNMGNFSVCRRVVFFWAGLASLVLGAPKQEKIAGAEDGVFYEAEMAENGILVLDANNGFFDKGKVRATGKGAVREHEKGLISASFEELEFLAGKKEATARWYLHAQEATEVTVTIEFGEEKERSLWSFGIGAIKRAFQVAGGSHRERFLCTLGKGKQEVRLMTGTNGQAAAVVSVKLAGAEGVALLRARWRPAAIHTRFSATGCPDPVRWIFESRSAGVGSSFSPMTTAFGYFGATFGDDGCAAGGVNFSMWALSQKGAKGKMPPLAEMPHLLATGNPEAEFGGFGHEGSGVKIRNWTPYAHRPKSVIQALRVEQNGRYDTYYGYLFDEREKRWVLYAMGNKVPKRKAGGTVRATSFCEVPGPPQVERTGDLERIMERRGWFVDLSGKVFPVDGMSTKARYQNHGISMSEDHWFQLKTGGLEFRNVPAWVESDFRHPVPEYLKPEVMKGLSELPVGIGASELTEVSEDSATITYNLEKAGREAKGILWYGEIDAVTFVPRKFHGTERGRASEDLFAKDRVWSQATAAQVMRKGENAFALKRLQRRTPYFYRLFVKNKEGQCWAAKSGSFATQ